MWWWDSGTCRRRSVQWGAWHYVDGAIGAECEGNWLQKRVVLLLFRKCSPSSHVWLFPGASLCVKWPVPSFLAELPYN